MLEISEDYIVVEDQGKEKTKITVPKIITKLIEVNKEYFIQYEYYKGETPQLVSIEPITSGC